ncbi:MAG: cysteine ABC transporter ATP-binding protein, partial [Gordonibacter sp.]
MFDKRLLALVPDARKHIIASVGFQWIGILATIALFVLVRSFLQNLLVSRAAFDGAAFVAACAAAAIVVRMACVAGAQKQGLAATAAAKQTVRQNVYDKLVALGPAYREQVATSEAVQISVEGAEQLER